MTGQRLTRAREVVQTISDDCVSDAAALDRTPFTPRGMGETFGTMLGMISGLAGVCAVLADEVTELRDSHPGNGNE